MIDDPTSVYYDDNDKLRIETGWSGDAQMGSFMNATLQEGDGDYEFSVACHVAVPYPINGEMELAQYLLGVFQKAIEAAPELHFHIVLGPAGAGEEEA